MADENGLAQLTLAGLASRLGVRQPSLYNHVNGLDELLRLMSVRAKRALTESISQAAVGRAGEQAIAAIAYAYRTWALRHPGRYLAAQRPPAAGDDEDEAATNAVLAVCEAVLAGYGLTGDDSIDAIRALRSTLHGFVTLETSGGFGLPVDIGRSFERLVAGLQTMLSAWAR